MKEKRAVSPETFVFILVVVVLFGYMGNVMGVGPMFSTMMNTAHALLLEVVFYIMAISVIAGAFSALLSEFGVIALVDGLIQPIMRPVYGLPGAASLGILTTFISDNPAILSLAKDKDFIKYFKDYQVPALCNLGTSFGMGLVLATFMIGQGNGTEFLMPAAVGIAGAVVGSIVSVRLMLMQTKKVYGITKEDIRIQRKQIERSSHGEIRVTYGSVFSRVMNASLNGGKNGVQLGMDIIPGVLVICTLVMMLTYGPGTDAAGAAAFTGAAYEGVGLLPKLGGYITPVMNVLFGFKDAGNIAFPLTALGATGAAMGLVPGMLKSGIAGANEIAVFTAIGMCWSGYLSTHISMMDALDRRKFVGPALLSHTFGGLAAGVAAHYIMVIISLVQSMAG